MKKITLIIALLTISLGFGQTNLITYGDFESPQPTGKITSATSPWSSSVSYTSGQSSVNNGANAYEGSQWLQMPNDYTAVRQSFTAVTNTEYTVSFWYQYPMPQGPVDGTDGIYVSIRQDTGGDGTQFGTPIQLYLDPSGLTAATWYMATFDFTATQTDLLFFLTKPTRVSSGFNNAARIDLVSIVETPTASLDDLQKFNFKSYPNPARDYIDFTASKNIDRVEIYNLLGQQGMVKDLNSTATKLDVSNLAKGVYVVKAFIEEAVGSYKFVKQ